MRLHSPYLTGALGGAFAALCFAVALAIPPAPQPKPDASIEPAISDSVNRAFKGDRLRVIVRPPGAEPFDVQAPPGSPPKLMDGCESAFSPMDQSSAAKLARRCTT